MRWRSPTPRPRANGLQRHRLIKAQVKASWAQPIATEKRRNRRGLGNGIRAIALGQKPRIEIHPLGIGGKEDPVRMVFTAKPAAGRVVCLVDMGDRFRMISNEIEIVEPTEDLPKLPVARAVWKPQPSLETSAEAWMLAGGSHHTVLTNSVTAEAIEDFARIAKVELVSIDEATEMRAFRKELQWSAAYHRLAERL